MGKSPAKWIKAVLLGKKASKSNLTKNVTTERTVSTNTGPTESDLLLEATNEGVEIIQPEKGTLVNLPSDESSSLPVIQSPNLHGTSSVNEEQASIKVQAAFRGYLARRAFRALKGIIRLQALIRGHLVRRQAIATLNCMQAIIKLQALVRGRKVRILYPNLQVKLTQNQVQPTFTQKLVTYTFAKKLIESLPNAMPLSLQYELTEPNSARNWLERWSIICFWEIIPQPKKIIDKKTKTKLPIESGNKSKRTIKKVPNVSNNDRNSKKITESTTQEHPQNELERVKRSLRKVSASEKPETDGSGPVPGPKSPPTEIEAPAKVIEAPVKVIEAPAKVIEAAPVKVIEDGPVKEEEVVEVIEENGGPTQKVVNRRRRSLPTKQEYTENVSQNTRTVPSYMLATESAKAKLRAQLAANNNNNNNNEEMNDLSENSFIRRHSLPSLSNSNNSKLSSVSPRVVKPLQANGKGGNKVNKSLDKGQVPPGWRR